MPAPSSHPPCYVAGHDGTPSGDAAVRLANALAGETGAQVTVVHVPEPGPRPVAAGLVAAAEAEAAALIVLGPHRGAPGVLTGSTARRLFEHSPLPVAVATQVAGPPATPIEHVAVGYDASEEAEVALGTAAFLAATLHADLRVIAATDVGPEVAEPVAVAGLEEVLRHARETVARLGVPATVDMAAGPAGPALVEASAHGVDLLVVGSRGRGPLEAVQGGSVSGHVAERSACPVLVVPASAGIGARQPDATGRQAALN